MVKKIRKRDGSVVFFQVDKIETAIWKAVKAVGGKDQERAKVISEMVLEKLSRIQGEHGIPDVEEVQDMIEMAINEDPELRILIRADAETKYKVNEKITVACAAVGAQDLIYSVFEE